jgi:hypothetical protein
VRELVSTVLDLNWRTALRLGGDPALYQAAPFLTPMKDPSQRLSLKFRGCSNCQRKAMERAGKQVASAMTALILNESKKPDNGLLALKGIIGKILNAKFSEVQIRYMVGAEQKEFRF